MERENHSEVYIGNGIKKRTVMQAVLLPTNLHPKFFNDSLLSSFCLPQQFVPDRPAFGR